MVIDVHDGSFCPGVWDEPLLDGVPIKHAIYADDTKGIVRTYDLGDGKLHSSHEDPEIIREQCGLAGKGDPMGITTSGIYWRELRGTVQLRRLSGTIAVE